MIFGVGSREHIFPIMHNKSCIVPTPKTNIFPGFEYFWGWIRGTHLSELQPQKLIFSRLYLFLGVGSREHIFLIMHNKSCIVPTPKDCKISIAGQEVSDLAHTARKSPARWGKNPTRNGPNLPGPPGPTRTYPDVTTCQVATHHSSSPHVTPTTNHSTSSHLAGLLVGMSSLPACCPSTLPLIFQLGRHAGGLTKRSAGNFAADIKPQQYAPSGLPMVLHHNLTSIYPMFDNKSKNQCSY